MMEKKEKQYGVSLIVTITEYCPDIEQLYLKFTEQIRARSESFECIFVQIFESSKTASQLKELTKKYPDTTALRLRSQFTEADAFSIGIRHSSGRLILTLPVYEQIDPADLHKAFEVIEREYDLVTCYRYPRKDAWLNRAESRVFNGLIRVLLNVRFNDLGCGVTLMTREVASSLDLYGDLFRFIPVLAARLGYRVGEVTVGHLPRKRKGRIYGIGVYIRRLLDIFTLFFIVKFTRKPLRFFGLSGAVFFALGVGINLHLTLSKFLGQSLANRPLLIVGVVSMVLGIQLLSMGLLGELIIFIHARKMKEYKIEQIVD